MGLVLTVDKKMVLSLNEKLFIEFFECKKGQTLFSVLDTDENIELEGLLTLDKDYQFLANDKDIITLSLTKSNGRDKVKLNIDAPKEIGITRVTKYDIPDIEYEFISLKRQNKRKTLFRKEHKDMIEVEKVNKKDALIEKYENELSWFFHA